jgi:hypothetical protein
MANKRTQNDENEDPETEFVGQVVGGVQKKIRGGNNLNKRATRSSSTAELETLSHAGDSNVSDDNDDDDPVVLQRKNEGRPSRGPPIVDDRRGGQVRNGNVGPTAVINNGWPPSRVFPFLRRTLQPGLKRECWNWCKRCRQWRASIQRLSSCCGGCGSQVGNGNVEIGANVVINGEPPSRDYPLVGGGREGQQGADNGNLNPFRGR